MGVMILRFCKNGLHKNMVLLILLALFIFIFYRNTNRAASIGIIGGADGPTAIFIASKLNPMFIIALVLLIAIVLLKIIKSFIK